MKLCHNWKYFSGVLYGPEENCRGFRRIHPITVKHRRMNKENYKTKLDDLLGPMEPCATFHDSVLHELRINYTERKLLAEFELCVGDPDSKDENKRERHRKGSLRVSSLVLWAMEPPGNRDQERWTPLWITDDGLISEAKTETARELSLTTLSPDMYGWYLYFSSINAFAYLAAKEAVFEWKAA